MKFALALLFLLLPSMAFAGNGSGNISSVIGLGCSGSNPCPIQIPASNPDGWFTLSFVGTATGNQFGAFLKNGGTQYQVPGTAITCYHMTYSTGIADDKFQLASSTAADGLIPASLSAGQKYESGATGAGHFGHVMHVANQVYDEAIAYTFAANSYPYLSVDTTSTYSIILTCK